MGDFENDHDRRVASFPPAVREAHRHSINHRAELLAGTLCGCFHCCTTFAAAEITAWTDSVGDEGQTALCPRCGIDAVLGERAGFELSDTFLQEMKRYWF